MSPGEYYYAAHNLFHANNITTTAAAASAHRSANSSTVVAGSDLNTSSYNNNNFLVAESYSNSNAAIGISSHNHHPLPPPPSNHHHHQQQQIHVTSGSSTGLMLNSLPTSNSSISGPVPHNECVSSFNTPSSIAITNNTLARVFSILVKLIRDLISTVYLEKKAALLLSKSKADNSGRIVLNRHQREQSQRALVDFLDRLIRRVNKKLDSPWQWLVSLMDATESQLRFGASLSASQSDFHSTSALQYLRHLEERALLTNYFNNNYGKL